MSSFLSVLFSFRHRAGKSRKSRCAVLFGVVLSLLLPCAAAAADLSVGLGAKVETSPYKGSSSEWSPFPLISYEDDQFYVKGLSVGVKALNLEYLELSGFAEYNPMSFDHQDTSNARLKRLDDRDNSVLLGLRAQSATPIGIFHASIARDITSGSGGYTGKVGYVYAQRFGMLEVRPTVGVNWNSHEFNDYYYGIGGNESRRSGLSAYSPGMSYSPYAGVTFSANLTDRLGIFCAVQGTYLGSDIRHSPMVGTTHTESFTTGFSFDF